VKERTVCLPGTAEHVRATCDHQAERRPVNRRAVLAAGGLAGLISLLPAPAARAAEQANRRNRLQDLTHTFSPTFPVGAPPAPTRATAFTIPRDGFYAQQWSFWEHTATHLDAPGHFIPGGRPVTAIDPAELMFLPVEVIDISERANRNPDTTLEVSDLRRHEARHGRIQDRAMVVMNSGWQRRVTIPGAFTNADPSGTYHFPGFSADAAEFLLEKRNITGVGVDTLSLDAGAVTGFPVHHRVLGADRIGLENLAHLDLIPPSGAQLFAGVIPWEAGSGGPCRVLAHY
jgi:kynurenine formamidase